MNNFSNFFVIHNFNMVPKELLKYCDENYILYDASTDENIAKELYKLGINYNKIDNTGHNLTTYFKFFIDNYDNLPDVMLLAKGNMIGRHCSDDFFERTYKNKWFTFLYEDKSVVLNSGMSALAAENIYLEKNNSWYVWSKNHPHRYFDNLNRLLKFIYVSPVIPEYCMFSPGGCYIVTKEQVRKNSKSFYINLNKIMSYGMNPSFPSEAHQIERILPIIFQSNYDVNSWMNSEEEFDEIIKREEIITQNNEKRRNSLLRKIGRKIKTLPKIVCKRR